MTKIFDYKISVNDKIVTFQILHQGPEVKKFFGDSVKKFGKMNIGNRSFIELSGADTIYLKGSSSRTSAEKKFSTASDAFSYASNLTESIDLMVTEIAKKTEKSVPDGANFKYSVTVEGSVVSLKILHQTREVTDFFRSAKLVGPHYIESMGCPEIREIGSDRLKVFIKGSSSAECATLTTSSQAKALRIASKITEIFDTAQKTWPEVFGTASKTKTLNVHKDSFLPGKVFMDVKDGELFIPTTSSGIGFSLSRDRAIEYNIKSSLSSWVLVGSMSEAIKIFGSDFAKSKILKKFRELNKTAVKQPWHK